MRAEMIAPTIRGGRFPARDDFGHAAHFALSSTAPRAVADWGASCASVETGLR